MSLRQPPRRDPRDARGPAGHTGGGHFSALPFTTHQKQNYPPPPTTIDRFWLEAATCDLAHAKVRCRKVKNPPGDLEKYKSGSSGPLTVRCGAAAAGAHWWGHSSQHTGHSHWTVQQAAELFCVHGLRLSIRNFTPQSDPCDMNRC